MSNNSNPREDQDYEAMEADRRYRDERRRSRSQSRHRRQNRDVSRSRSRSLRRRRHHRSSYSRSRSNSKSRSNSRGYSSSRRGSGRYSSRRQRDSRSRSRSLTRRSNSRSHSSYKYGTRRYSRSRSRTPTRSRYGSNNHSRGRRSQSQEEHGRNKNVNNTTLQSIHQDESNTSSSYAGGDVAATVGATVDNNDLHNLPLPQRRNEMTTSGGGAVGRSTSGRGGPYYNLDTDEPIDKERIHREMEEKLRLALAKEGKVYPPPKPEASHPVFANDGSFLEIFKKMQQQQQQQQHQPITAPIALPILASTSVGASTSVAAKTSAPPPPPPPIVGRRRGGKILKTGVVAKPKAQQESGADPKDFWSLYLAEVNKYKNNACESDGGTRPLVK